MPDDPDQAVKTIGELLDIILELTTGMVELGNRSGLTSEARAFIQSALRTTEAELATLAAGKDDDQAPPAVEG